MGNTILSDDASGILAAKSLYETVIKLEKKDVDFVELSCGGWRLIDFFHGYDKIVIIDAIEDYESESGTLVKIDDISESLTLRLKSSHGIGFFETLKLAKMLGVLTAVEISIYAISARNVREFGESVDKRISDNIPSITRRLLQDEFGLLMTS